MFDDIGPNHRQGTAIFTEAFISVATTRRSRSGCLGAAHAVLDGRTRDGPRLQPRPLMAEVARRPYGIPWIPLTDEPEARSFMNYPYNVAGGETRVLRELRVPLQQCRAAVHATRTRHDSCRWATPTGSTTMASNPQMQPLQASEYRLEVRANRQRTLFEFLEPVILEVKLTNTGRDPKLIRTTTLTPQSLVVIIKPEGKPARQWIPYARMCLEPRAEVLDAGAAAYESLPLFAGLNGWDVAEPGAYDIQVAAEVDGVIVFSDPLHLRIAAPRSFEEESLAADFFTEEVGRTLAFSGSVALTRANDTLRETVDRLPSSRAAIHAAVALAQPLARDFKSMTIPETDVALTSVAEAEGKVTTRSAEPQQAVELIAQAVGGDQGGEAAETLGHVRYRRQMEGFTESLAQTGEGAAAKSLQTDLAGVLADRGVLASVVQEVEDKASTFKTTKARRAIDDEVDAASTSKSPSTRGRPQSGRK